jgi:RimJ/RimL family protein N-acetyltransferase
MLDAVLKADALNPGFRTYLRLAEPTVADAAYICELRSDPELSKHLNRSSAEVEDQRRWLEAYKDRETKGEEYYFFIMCGGANAGVVRIYDLRFDQRPTSFGWGSWIVPGPRAPGLVTFSALLVYEIGFDVLRFEQAHFDVRRENTGVIDFHMRAGAVQTDEREEDLFFTYSPEAYLALKAASAERYAEHRIAV